MFFAPILSAPQEEGRSSEWIGTHLQAVVAHTKFGSNAFHHAVAKFLSDNNFIELRWQPHLGHSPLRVGFVLSGAPSDCPSIAFWPGPHGTFAQALPAIHTVSAGWIDSIDRCESWRNGDRPFLCGGVWIGGNIDWPFAAVFTLAKDRWRMIAARAPYDENVGQGRARFLRIGRRVLPNEVATWVEVYPDHIGQSHVGPLLEYDQIWTLRSNRFEASRARLVDSPIAALDHLCYLASHKKWANLLPQLPPQHRREMLDFLPNAGSVTQGDGNTLLCNWRGLKMFFAKRRGKWRLIRVAKLTKSTSWPE